jgi:hypothetical protein
VKLSWEHEKFEWVELDRLVELLKKRNYQYQNRDLEASGIIERINSLT